MRNRFLAGLIVSVLAVTGLNTWATFHSAAYFEAAATVHERIFETQVQAGRAFVVAEHLVGEVKHWQSIAVLFRQRLEDLEQYIEDNGLPMPKGSLTPLPPRQEPGRQEPGRQEPGRRSEDEVI